MLVKIFQVLLLKYCLCTLFFFSGKDVDTICRMLTIAPWKTLDLECNGIGSEGLIKINELLRENTKLTDLDLCYNGLGDEGAILISGILKISNSLSKLNLAMNNIGAEGASAICETLMTNTSLTELSLSRKLKNFFF